MFELSKLRTFWWCQNNWPEQFSSEFYFLANPALFRVVLSVHKLISRWCPPTLDPLKFNVDGAVKGSFGAAGVGGILRDHFGKVLASFSVLVGKMDATSAEIAIIKEANRIFLSNPKWLSN
ncbi:hypothetical protein V6N12_069080 [Hibiscus sabdariffa]|uniref:RNase H type-1 domain-containing protein n=1 Tax=Hibiscus sabdariffa TaxID=183260 RepID=A0ABR2FD75_9ROSI